MKGRGDKFIMDGLNKDGVPDADNPEWTHESFQQAVPFAALPASLKRKLKDLQRRGRPRSKAPKQMIAFRFAPDLLARIKSSGRGYNARVEKLLREAWEEGRL